MAECFMLSVLTLGANKLSASREKQMKKYSQRTNTSIFSSFRGKKKMQPGLDSHENFIALLNSAVSSTCSLLLNISGILRKVFNCTIVYLPLAF